MKQSINLEKFQRLVRLYRTKAVLREKVSVLNKEIDEVATEVETDLILSGVKNLPLTVDDDPALVYVWSQSQPKFKEGFDRSAVAAAMKERGVGIVKDAWVDPGAFGSWCREMFKDGEPPEWLSKMVEMETVSTARVRKA